MPGGNQNKMKMKLKEKEEELLSAGAGWQVKLVTKRLRCCTENSSLLLCRCLYMRQ